MEITITGHHMNITDSVREYVNKRLKKVGNHFRHPTKVDVILHKEKSTFQSEATVHARKVYIHAKSEAPDMFKAIDAMSSKLDRQVIKHKELRTDHGRHSDGQRTIRY
ncbi:MAG: ribosome-associated translation inhibitor RaiA [Acidiferrobacterales bacterium]|nr:ribosome-associated translation inhibitor RaiA [Acidiferrobacterales bacterium]